MLGCALSAFVIILSETFSLVEMVSESGGVKRFATSELKVGKKLPWILHQQTALPSL